MALSGGWASCLFDMPVCSQANRHAAPRLAWLLSASRLLAAQFHHKHRRTDGRRDRFLDCFFARSPVAFVPLRIEKKMASIFRQFCWQREKKRRREEGRKTPRKTDSGRVSVEVEEEENNAAVATSVAGRQAGRQRAKPSNHSCARAAKTETGLPRPTAAVSLDTQTACSFPQEVR